MDWSKAYEHVIWEVYNRFFLLLLLVEKNVIQKKKRENYYKKKSTIGFLILVNESPKDFFGSSRGLR